MKKAKDINEREVALFALLEISESGYNNIVLQKSLSKLQEAPQVKKAFVTEVVNGVLRNQIYLDYVIESVSTVTIRKMKPFIRYLLRMSVYQMKFMDKTPAYAICDEAVKLAKKRGFAPLSNFVNGVLRNIPTTVTLPDSAKLPVQYLSVAYSYPKWLVEYWLKTIPAEVVEQFSKNSAAAPKVTLCVNTLKNTREELQGILKEEGIHTQEGTLEDSLFVSNLPGLRTLLSFTQGRYHVMDEAAQSAVLLMDPKPGQTVLDCCAAPGGKSFYAAYRMGDAGEILSWDLHEHKISLLEEGICRLGLKSVLHGQADALKFDPTKKEAADYVLLDVPCTGFGLLRKKPDIKMNKTMEDVLSLAALQRRMLETCWQYVKPGGVLLYCTCTVSYTENEENVLWFLKNFPFKEDTTTQILPSATKDGFFISRLIRS